MNDREPQDPQSDSGAMKKKAGGAAHFLLRLISSIVLWLLVLAAIFFTPPFVFYAVFTVITCLALWEFYDIIEAAGMRCYRNWGMVGSAALVMGGWFFFEKGVLTPK